MDYSEIRLIIYPQHHFYIICTEVTQGKKTKDFFFLPDIKYLGGEVGKIFPTTLGMTLYLRFKSCLRLQLITLEGGNSGGGIIFGPTSH